MKTIECPFFALENKDDEMIHVLKMMDVFFHRLKQKGIDVVDVVPTGHRITYYVSPLSRDVLYYLIGCCTRHFHVREEDPHKYQVLLEYNRVPFYIKLVDQANSENRVSLV